MLQAPCLSVSDVAKFLRVHRRKVLAWIDKGQLRAVDVGAGRGPQYRITQDDFDDFVRSRTTQPPVKVLLGRKIKQFRT